MGLFVADNGFYRGWLAALLCCCAAVDEDEHPLERAKARSATRPGVCTDQPLPLQSLPPYSKHPSNSTLQFKDDEPILQDDLLRPISERPPSLRPLDLGESSLLGRISSSNWRRSFNGNAHVRSPSINAPSNYRRTEHIEKQRHSLVPLKLSPVVLRQPSPRDSWLDDGDRSPRSTESLMDASKRTSYLASRETPYQRCQQLNPGAGGLFSSPNTARPMEPIQESLSTQSALSAVSSSSSISSIRKQAIETNALSFVSRSSFEGKRLKRKRSLQSRRKLSAGSEDAEVDREILELNTIVEERRAEAAARPGSPEFRHVAAIAPSLPISERVRTETLTSIGSAFARPSTAQPAIQTSARLSRPFTNMPEPIHRPTTAHSTARPESRSSNRVSGWLSDLLAQRHPQDSQILEQALSGQRPGSEISLCTTTFSETESPALTVASSPMLKGHSRSLTAESRITPLSPPASEEPERSCVGKERPGGWLGVVESASQVGLAI